MSRLPLVAAALAALPAWAQADRLPETTTEPVHSCVLLADAHEHRLAGQPSAAELDARVAAWRAEANPTSQVVVTEGGSSTFIVTYTGFDAYPLAQAAYQAAVDLWATHLASASPIRVTAEFAPLGANVLGSAGPFLVRNFPGAPETGVWYPTAIADAINGADLGNGAADIRSRFSSNFTNWYFGTDGGPASSQFDFRTVVLHELGHGLGFSGSGRWDDGATAGRCDGTLGNGCWGYNGQSFGGSPTVFDLLVQNGQGVALLDGTVYPNNSAALGGLLLSGDLWATGPRIQALPDLDRGRLYAPEAWNQGSSYSHWSEGTYPRTNVNALMTPQVAPGEAQQSPGPLTCAFFGDMGWPLGPGCAAFVADEGRPSTTAAALRVTGANPFSGATQVRLSLEAPADVRAALYDVTGREVRSLYDGAAGAGPLTIAVPGAGLAAGVYAVRVTAGAEVAEVRVVLAR